MNYPESRFPSLSYDFRWLQAWPTSWLQLHERVLSWAEFYFLKKKWWIPNPTPTQHLWMWPHYCRCKKVNMMSLGQALNQHDWCPARRGTFGHRHMGRRPCEGEGRDRVMQQKPRTPMLVGDSRSRPGDLDRQSVGPCYSSQRKLIQRHYTQFH